MDSSVSKQLQELYATAGDEDSSNASPPPTIRVVPAHCSSYTPPENPNVPFNNGPVLSDDVSRLSHALDIPLTRNYSSDASTHPPRVPYPLSIQKQWPSPLGYSAPSTPMTTSPDGKVNPFSDNKLLRPPMPISSSKMRPRSWSGATHESFSHSHDSILVTPGRQRSISMVSPQSHGHYSGPSSPAAPASFYYPSDSPALPFANCSSIPNSPFFGDFEISLPSSSANSPQFQISSPDWAHFSLSPSLVPLPPSPSTISNSPSPSNILLPLSPSSNLSSPIIPLSPALGSQENDVFGTSYFSNEPPPFPSLHPSFTASHIEPGTSAVQEVLQYGLLQTYARVPITNERSGTGSRMLEEAQAAGNVHSSPSPDTSTDLSNLSVNLQGFATLPMTGNFILPHRINPSSVHHLTPGFSMLFSPTVPNFSFVDAVGPSSYDTFSVDSNVLDQVPTITANAQNLVSHRWPQRLTLDGETGHPQESYDVPASVSRDHIFGIKQRVLTVLKNSNTAEDAVRQVDELDRIKQPRLYHHVFKEALDHQPKVSAASKLNAEERRKRDATFRCILCDSLFTTKNNLLNHYRSHLKMDEYICPGCNKAFRTESISTRHKRSCRKVTDSTGIKGKRRVSHI